MTSSTYSKDEIFYLRLKSMPFEFTLNQFVAAHHRGGSLLQVSQIIFYIKYGIKLPSFYNKNQKNEVMLVV